MDYKKLKDSLKLDTLNLANGTTSRQIACPACGTKGDFSISKSASGQELYYCCFRATCGFRGRILLVQDLDNYICDPVDKKFIPNPLRDELFPVPVDIAQHTLWSKYTVDPTQIISNGISYEPRRDALVFPIHALYGNVVGYTTKRLKKGSHPKSINYWSLEPEIFMHFPRVSDELLMSRTVVVVEDVLSSIRVARYMRAVAMLGSHITLDSALYLSKHFDNLVLAFDPDATTKAIKYQREFSLLFSSIDVVHLSADPKDLTEINLVRELNLL